MKIKLNVEIFNCLFYRNKDSALEFLYKNFGTTLTHKILDESIDLLHRRIDEFNIEQRQQNLIKKHTVYVGQSCRPIVDESFEEKRTELISRFDKLKRRKRETIVSVLNQYAFLYKDKAEAGFYDLMS